MITLISLHFISIWLSNGWYRNYFKVLNFYKCYLSARNALITHLHLIMSFVLGITCLKNTFDFFLRKYFQASSM